MEYLDRISEPFLGLGWGTVFGAFFAPVAHLLFDHPRVGSWAPAWEQLFGDFLDQCFVPPGSAKLVGWALRQPTPEDLQCPGEGHPAWGHARPRRGLMHRTPDQSVRRQQAVEF